MAVAELSLAVLVLGFLGGILGAALGALTALGLAGVAIVLGELFAVVTGGTPPVPFLDGTASPVAADGLGGALGLGPVLGPHVAFAGGVAAAAYAGRKRTFDTEFRYHQAKQIARPLPRSPWIYLVGGAFGLGGVILARLVAVAGIPADPIALVVVLSAFAHRLVFGYPVLGRLGGLDRSLLDMSPFENAAYWGEPGHETAQGVGGRHVVEPWLPEYYEWGRVALLGAGAGLVGGGLAALSGRVFLAFGLAAASLLLVPLGRHSVPVTHHAVLPASILALAVDADPLVGLVAAVVAGVATALLAELAQRLLYAHADTHLDPSFVAILLASLVLTMLASAGLLDAGAIPYSVP